MNAADVKRQIEKLEKEIVHFKSEIYDRYEALRHLEAVHNVMHDEENTKASE